MESVDKFIHQTKKYLHLEELTPTVLNDMVNAVYVHAPDKSSGHRVQDVDISYIYIGILPVNLLYDIQNGKTARPKSCRFSRTYYTVLLEHTIRMTLLLK